MKEFILAIWLQRAEGPSWREAGQQGGDMWQGQEAESSQLQAQTQNRGSKPEVGGGYELSKPAPSDILPSAAPPPQTPPPTEDHLLGHLSSKPLQHPGILWHGDHTSFVTYQSKSLTSTQLLLDIPFLSSRPILYKRGKAQWSHFIPLFPSLDTKSKPRGHQERRLRHPEIQACPEFFIPPRPSVSKVLFVCSSYTR